MTACTCQCHNRIPDLIPAPFTASERMVSVQEAAARLSVSRHAIYSAIERGELPARKVGRVLRIPLGAMARFGEQQTPRPVEQVAAVIRQMEQPRQRPYNRVAR